VSDACCNVPPPPRGISYRRVLWVALFANGSMFFVELTASLLSGSSALAADAADFLGDATNYGLSLAALAAGGAWLSRVAMLKGAGMALYGAGVLGYAGWRAWLGTPPEPLTMGAVGLLALAVNFSVAALLFRFREGDANMRSVWICSRNDAIGNLAVVAAAAGVFGTGSGWPDIAVAAIMGALGISGGWQIVRQAVSELHHTSAPLLPHRGVGQ